MNRTIVTRFDNVEFDEEKQPMIDEEGSVLLKNTEAVGYIESVSIIPFTQVDPQTQQLAQGLVTRAIVYWEHQRNPSPALEDPSDLFWIAFASEEDEYEDDDEDGEEIEATETDANFEEVEAQQDYEN